MIKHNYLSYNALWILAFSVALPGFACRYNVRDIGFVNLGDKNYRIYGFVDDTVAGDKATVLSDMLTAGLTESNIIPQIINVDRQQDNPARKYLEKWQITKFPALVLVSPRGKSLPLPLPDGPFKQAVLAAIRPVTDSPLRSAIKKQINLCYGAVLIIDGTDPAENNRVRQAAKEAISNITMQMNLMPKEIAKPPVLFTLAQKDFPREKILLWSLGLDPDRIRKTQAVILYGRLRRMGPLLAGEQINEVSLNNFLSVIGADCECGLDRAWMTGDLLPAKWERKLEIQAAESLGFDPEHPMVRMEISQIIGRPALNSSSEITADSLPDVPFGYQELVVKFDSDDEPQTADTETKAQTETKNAIKPESVAEDIPGPTPAAAPETSVVPSPPLKRLAPTPPPVQYKVKPGQPQQATAVESTPSWHNLALLAGSISLLVLLFGMGILWKAKQKSE